MASTDKPIVICVFCGSQSGTNPAYLAGARSLAAAMHAVGAKLVYGSGTVGIMGEVARTLVSLSGPDAVHGIIPAPLVRYEQAGRPTGNGTTTTASSSNSAESPKSGPPRPDEAIYGRTTVVKDMHTRKAAMAKEVLAGGPGSGFVALPGGYGTLEELMEITTWNQLGIHKAPICVLNTEGYYDGLVNWIRKSVEDGFVSEGNKDIIAVANKPEEVLKLLKEYQPATGRFDLDWDATTPVDEKNGFT